MEISYGKSLLSARIGNYLVSGRCNESKRYIRYECLLRKKTSRKSRKSEQIIGISMDDEQKEILYELKGIRSEQRKIWKEMDELRLEQFNQKSWLNGEFGRQLPNVSKTEGNIKANIRERFERVEKISNDLKIRSDGPNGILGDHTKITLVWRLHAFAWIFVGGCIVWIAKYLLTGK